MPPARDAGPTIALQTVAQDAVTATRPLLPTHTPAPPETGAVEPTAAQPPTQAATPVPEALNVPPQEYNLRDVAITLERTVCFGTCPAYVVTIHGDGTVDYNGIQFVKVTGTQTKKIAPEAVVELLREFYKIDFFALRDEYTSQRDIQVAPDGTVQELNMQVTDLPSTYITLRIGDYSKRIHNYFGAPESLNALANQIDATAGTEEWVK